MSGWSIQFWLPGRGPGNGERIFGCASHGLGGAEWWCDPEEEAAPVAPWVVSSPCSVLAGQYSDVLADLARFNQCPAAACVLFRHAKGVEAFLAAWPEMFKGVPTVGGGAARGPDQAQADLLPEVEDVAVLLIHKGAWRAETLNVHEPVGIDVDVRARNSRTIRQLRRLPEGAWEPAASFFRSLQADFSRSQEDCESITFSTPEGRNLHVSLGGEVLHTGADLPIDGRLEVRVATRPVVAEQLAAFCSTPGSLVFGCAGLWSLLEKPLPVAPKALATFMFGEVVACHGNLGFGNLMASRLVPVNA